MAQGVAAAQADADAAQAAPVDGVMSGQVAGGGDQVGELAVSVFVLAIFLSGGR